MVTTILGKTGLEVVRLAIGGGYGMDADSFRAGLDMGLNYIDTARGYLEGKDEEVIGEAVRGRRDRVILATKAMARDDKGAAESLEASLRALQTDYIDIWQMHWVNTPDELSKVMAPDGALDVGFKAKEEGKVRFFGVTGHNWPQMARNVATGLFDTILMWYNCAFSEPEEIAFPLTMRHNMGVVIMNNLRGGKLLTPPSDWPADRPVPQARDFYRFVLSNPAVHVSASGVQNLDQLKENVRALEDFKPMTPEEIAWMKDYGAALRKTGVLGEGD
ncbi:MAG: aldo/keto reductase [Armatimonadetes bacterium]|nr:aldo/keto reductase [Armatimonadota bacterium]